MLSNIKVLEFAGLAPTVFTGMLLADYGAQVTTISRIDGEGYNTPMNRGKKSMTFDLKNKADIEAIKVMIKNHDVLIDPFRPGVLERLGLSYEVCQNLNPKLIYCSVTGFGQSSPLKSKAGHDINFISYGGVLAYCASTGFEKRPAIPGNVVGDFAAGGLLAATSILAALIYVKNGGRGQQIDLGMAQGAAYLSQFIIHQKNLKLWSNGNGNNILDGGTHFYNIYKCKDGRFMSVGCLEEKFYKEYIEGLINGGLKQQRAQYMLENQLNSTVWNDLIKEISELFLTKTRDEWQDIYSKLDACVTPVIDLEEYEEKEYLGKDVFFKRNGQLEAYAQPIFSKYQFKTTEIPILGQHNNEKPKL